MMATPTDLEDFALGFSLTEELIQSADDLRAPRDLPVQPGGRDSGDRGGTMYGGDLGADQAAHRPHRLRYLWGGQCGCGAQADPSGRERCHPQRAGRSARAGVAGRQSAAQCGQWGGPCRGLGSAGRHAFNDPRGRRTPQRARQVGGSGDGGPRGAFGRLHRGHQPRQLRDGTEGHGAWARPCSRPSRDLPDWRSGLRSRPGSPWWDSPAGGG